MLLFLFYEHFPGTVRSFAREWNRWIGPLLYFVVIWPVHVVVIVTQNLLPLYNFAVKVTGSIASSIALTAVTQMGAALVDLATSLSLGAVFVAQSFLSYVDAISARVDGCAGMGRSCFEMVEWDLVPALKFVAPATRSGVALVTGMCPVLAPPIDLVLYPLTDPNLPAALSGAVNMLLLTLVEAPRVTAQRCRLHRADIGLVACLPDLQRLYEHFAAMVRTAAALVDNWLDMSLVILGAAINQQSPACAETEKRNRTVEFSQAFFRQNVTAVVALSCLRDAAVQSPVTCSKQLRGVLHPGLGFWGWSRRFDMAHFTRVELWSPSNVYQ
mmetsp:Transcript_21995/g.44274  ORF Transcript_21995/g.44274 Transcript_21995/m.44274 type:complete len:328 (+) Transcript_21995:502-1485(+)